MAFAISVYAVLNCAFAFPAFEPATSCGITKTATTPITESAIKISLRVNANIFFIITKTIPRLCSNSL